jgi:hypothetical protein
MYKPTEPSPSVGVLAKVWHLQLRIDSTTLEVGLIKLCACPQIWDNAGIACLRQDSSHDSMTKKQKFYKFEYRTKTCTVRTTTSSSGGELPLLKKRTDFKSRGQVTFCLPLRDVYLKSHSHFRNLQPRRRKWRKDRNGSNGRESTVNRLLDGSIYPG